MEGGGVDVVFWWCDLFHYLSLPFRLFFKRTIYIGDTNKYKANYQPCPTAPT